MRRSIIATVILLSSAGTAFGQAFDDSGINAGFFDSSTGNINFSNFHLPPLSVLFENAKSTPKVLSAAKAEELARAEVLKQKKHIFSYFKANGSYSYGKTDLWGNNSSTMSNIVYQYQGKEQSYWNVGANVSLPIEDILDLGSAVKRKRLAAEQAQYEKEETYDQLKLQIATLYVKITNELISLKTASENAAVYQGAGSLSLEDFHNGNITIREFAETKRWESEAVSEYQGLQTQLITDILTLEIMTHTPIITNSTTEVTLSSYNDKDTRKELKRQIKEEQKAIKESIEAEQNALEAEEKAEAQKAKEEKKNAAKEEKKASKKN